MLSFSPVRRHEINSDSLAGLRIYPLPWASLFSEISTGLAARIKTGDFLYASSCLKAESEKSKEAAEQKETALPQVPKRKLGKTGIQVPSLSLGSNASEDPILLRKALDLSFLF